MKKYQFECSTCEWNDLFWFGRTQWKVRLLYTLKYALLSLIQNEIFQGEMRFVKKVHQMIWHIKSRSFTSALRASFCTGNVRYILLYKGAGKCQAWVERTVVVCQFPKELLLYLSLPLDYTIHTQCMKFIKKSLIFNSY